MSDVKMRPAAIASIFLTIACIEGVYAQELPSGLKKTLDSYGGLEPVAVKWIESWKSTPTGRQRIPTETMANMMKNYHVVDYAIRGECMYQRRESSTGPKTPARVMEFAFDGEIFYSGNPDTASQKNKQPSLVKWLPGKDAADATYFSSEYFQYAGIRIPTRMSELSRSHKPVSDLLALREEGGRIDAIDTATIDSRKLTKVCIVAVDKSQVRPMIDLRQLEVDLRRLKFKDHDIQMRLANAAESNNRKPPERRFEFYFDEANQWSIRRIDTRDAGGKLLVRSDCLNHEFLANRGLSLPRECRVGFYTFADLPGQPFDTPLYEQIYTIKEIDLGAWPADRFALRYTEPGTYINDATLPEARNGKNGIAYFVPADAALLDDVVREARQQYAAAREIDKRSERLRIGFFIFNSFIVIAFSIYAVRRWRRRGGAA